MFKVTPHFGCSSVADVCRCTHRVLSRNGLLGGRGEDGRGKCDLGGGLVLPLQENVSVPLFEHIYS